MPASARFSGDVILIAAVVRARVSLPPNICPLKSFLAGSDFWLIGYKTRGGKEGRKEGRKDAKLRISSAAAADGGGSTVERIEEEEEEENPAVNLMLDLEFVHFLKFMVIFRAS